MDKRLLGRPREYNGGSAERNDFKFVFKSYIGVVAPPILATMNHAETTTGPITIGGLSAEDKLSTRSLSFLLAQVLSTPLLQLMMNVHYTSSTQYLYLLPHVLTPFQFQQLSAVRPTRPNCGSCCVRVSATVQVFTPE